MSAEEIQKTRDKFNSKIKKGGNVGKNAEKLLNKFDDAVAEQDWKKAREIAGMEQRGLFGKLFQDSQGNTQWGKVLGLAAGGIVGYGIGALFSKADVNAVAVEKCPKVFAVGKDAIPIRVVVDQEKDACSGQGMEVLSGFTFGFVPCKHSTDSSVRVTVSVFGVEQASSLSFRTEYWMALTNPLVLAFGSPENDCHPAFSRSGIALNAIDEGTEASRVFSESVAAVVAQILIEQESRGVYFAAKNNLRPDAAVGEKYGILLDKGLISKDEYEQAIVRYAELRDPSRIAIDIGKLRDQGVISQEDYRDEVLKAFHAKQQDADKGSGQ